MNCTLCNLPVILTPSAAERAKRYGGKPSDYTALFPMHAACTLAKCEADTAELMARHRAGAACVRVWPTVTV